MPAEIVRARGHGNILCTHKTTLEFTCDKDLSKRGDCIFATSADKSMGDLSDEFKQSLKREGTVLEMTLECGGVTEKVVAHGHSNLTLNHPSECVIRKSDFICSRTLAIKSDKAAKDLDRRLVEKLVEGFPVVIKLEVIQG